MTSLDALLAELRRKVEEVERENTELRAEVARLAKDNGELLDHVHELQQMNFRRVG